MKNTTVHQLAHNGACWEHIPGANWSMPVPDGQTIAETLLSNGPSGEWPDDDSERVCLRVTDDCGDDLLDTDGDWRFVFTAGELRLGNQCQPFAGSVERIYQIAFVLESTGDFETVETFAASGNDAANAYAEAHYAGRDWYVLDSAGENINA